MSSLYVQRYVYANAIQWTGDNIPEVLEFLAQVEATDVVEFVVPVIFGKNYWTLDFTLGGEDWSLTNDTEDIGVWIVVHFGNNVSVEILEDADFQVRFEKAVTAYE